MEEITVFSSPMFGDVRVTGSAEDPQFCLADVCKVLELQPAMVMRRLTDGVYCTHPIIDSLGREQVATFVNEDGLYDVILDSRKPEAKKFRKWLTSEVIPSIRKTGGYMMAKADETPEEIMARALLVAQDTMNRQKQKLQMLESENEVLSKENAKMLPKAQFVDEVLQSTTTYTIGEVGKEIGFRSAQAFNRRLHDDKFIYNASGHWLPYADWSDKGYFATRTARFVKRDESIGTSTSTVITEKGRMFFIERYKRRQQTIAM